MTKAQLEAALTGTLVICALLTTGLVVRREIFAQRVSDSSQKSAFIANWKSQVAKGVQLGSPNAPVQVIEFADFECPFCGDFHKKLKGLRERYPTQVTLTYVHFPIPGHRFALPAARVAECAGDQGRFEAMYDELFDGQEQFGLKPWDDYATAAGVGDLQAFDACVKKTDELPRVAEGLALGKELDVQGTPTLLVNGWKLGHPPTAEELEAMVKAVLAGKEPVSGAGKS